tara:strand:+ start:1080 stop:3968 length:2889 start_codon:yes stop_codon:yes gene_type:complete
MAKKNKTNKEEANQEEKTSKIIGKKVTLRQQELNVSKEQLKVSKELLAIEKRKGKLNEDDIRFGTLISNTLLDQVKHLKLQGNEKSKIQSLSKKLVTLSEKVYTFDLKGLGTTTKAEKIQKQLLNTQQNLKILALQKNKIGAKDSELQSEINQNIDLQIASTGKVTAQLERQLNLAKEIEDNKIADSFDFLSKTLSKIPLLRNLAPAFAEGSDAAREMGAEMALFGSGMLEASDYTGENLKKFARTAKVEFTHTSDSVKQLQIDAKNAQAKLKGTKGSERTKLKKVIKKGETTKVGDTEELFGAAAKSSLEKGTSKLTGFNKGMAKLNAAFSKMGPVLNKLIGAALVAALFKADGYITDIQNNLGVSYDSAYKLNLQFNKMANNSNNLRVNLKSIREASKALNDAYGTALMFNEETLVASAEILQSKLLDGKATANLAATSRINGQTVKQALKSQEDTVNSVNKQYKTRLALKPLLDEANKITGQIGAQLRFHPKSLMEATAKAKALGMELSTVASAAGQLLDFESSIEAELTAELMLGRSINLEKARLYALTGDYSGLMSEINTQVGDFGDFMSMNVLQQDALAKSMGMSSDQLSDQLMKKANLNELAEEALALGEDQKAEDLMRLSNQQKFEQAVIKVQDAFVSLMSVVAPVANLIGGMVSALGYIVDSAKGFVELLLTSVGLLKGGNTELSLAQSIIGAMAATYVAIGITNKLITFFAKQRRKYEISSEKSLIRQGLIMLRNLAVSIADSVAAVVGMSAKTLGVAAGIALAAGAATYAFLSTKKAGDVASPADGKTQISTKEGGIFELSKNDDVAAGPGILDKLKGAMLGSPMGLMGGIMGMLNPFAGLTSMVNNMAEAIIAKVDIIVGNIEQKLIDPTNELEASVLAKNTTSGKTQEREDITSILEKELTSIRKLLSEKQNITLDINNAIQYDSFSANNAAYVNGKSAEEINNNSSFI